MKMTRKTNPYIRSQLADLFRFIVAHLVVGVTSSLPAGATFS
jgi:hypothetical protein